MKINDNTFAFMVETEEYDRAKKLQAVVLRNRYWRDHQGQPRLAPGRTPLLHNGGKPR